MELTYTEGSYQVYEAGVYAARLVSWEAVPVPEPPRFPDQKPQIRFSWALLDERGNPTEATISSWVNQNFNRSSFLADVVRAVTGGDIAPGYRLNVGDLIGKDCMLTVSVGRKSNGDEKNKVESYAPVRSGPPTLRAKAGAAPAAPRPQAVAAGVEELPF